MDYGDDDLMASELRAQIEVAQAVTRQVRKDGSMVHPSFKDDMQDIISSLSFALMDIATKVDGRDQDCGGLF